MDGVNQETEFQDQFVLARPQQMFFDLCPKLVGPLVQVFPLSPLVVEVLVKVERLVHGGGNLAVRQEFVNTVSDKMKAGWISRPIQPAPATPRHNYAAASSSSLANAWKTMRLGTLTLTGLPASSFLTLPSLSVALTVTCSPFSSTL